MPEPTPATFNKKAIATSSTKRKSAVGSIIMLAIGTLLILTGALAIFGVILLIIGFIGLIAAGGKGAWVGACPHCGSQFQISLPKKAESAGDDCGVCGKRVVLRDGQLLPIT